MSQRSIPFSNFKSKISLFQIIIISKQQNQNPNMPSNQNNQKFLKRRKYCQLNSQNNILKLQFDLQTKKILQEKEKNFCHPVSEQKIQPNGKNNYNQMTKPFTSMKDFEKTEYQAEQKNEGSWNYFSFSEINQNEYQQNKINCSYWNQQTAQDLQKVQEIPTLWNSYHTGVSHGGVCSIQYY